MILADMPFAFYVIAGFIICILILAFISFRLRRRRREYRLRQLLKQNDFAYTVIDIRSAEEYSRSHIPGAIHLPMENVGSVFPVENMFQPLYVYGTTEFKARKASRILENTGYFNVQSVGGFRRWRWTVEG